MLYNNHPGDSKAARPLIRNEHLHEIIADFGHIFNILTARSRSFCYRPRCDIMPYMMEAMQDEIRSLDTKNAPVPS